MKSLKNLFIISCFTVLVSVTFAQETNDTAVIGIDADGDQISLPYVAEIVSDRVNIRSGPGTNYYSCGKLNKGDRVKVIAHKYSWSHIIPPKGSFSWISKRYVQVAEDNPAIGVVTGDAVRVYAGSPTKRPIQSDRMQLKLNKGARVALMGEVKDDYYKIAPPQGAYLWVNTMFTKPLGSIGKFPLDVEQKPEPIIVTTSDVIVVDELKMYYNLEKQLKDERSKPMVEQDYSSIKRELVKIAADKSAGKAARYSEFAIKQVERFELALASAQAVALQDKQLADAKKHIEQARRTRLAALRNLGRFAAIGILKKSEIYGSQAGQIQYRLLNESGKMLCYVLPAPQNKNANLTGFLSKKVGLVGKITAHKESAGVLVRFSAIVVLK